MSEVIRIRLDKRREEVRKKWRELLYEYKKRGLKAEDVLADALECLERHMPIGGAY